MSTKRSGASRASKQPALNNQPSPSIPQPTWDLREAAVSGFLVAAKTAALRAACDLLLVNGNDLVWDDWIEGLYLAQVTHEDRFADILEVMGAKSDIATVDLVHAYAPTLRSVMQRAVEAVAQTGQAAAPNKLIEILVTEYQQAGIKQILMPANEQRVDVQKHLTQFLTLGVGRGALSLRQRFLGATGLTSAQYSDMLGALSRMGACEPVFRVAFPENTFSPEWSMSGGSGFRASTLVPGASALEVYRIAPPLAETKRGQDVALALFIAAYLNRHSALERPVARACYRPKGRASGDLDVWIKRIRVGCEVKLYQAPAVQTANKIVTLARELEGQLPTYFDLQCERIFYVTNLPPKTAADVLERASKQLTRDQRAKLHVVTGRDSVLMLLSDLTKELEKAAEADWEAAMQGFQQRAEKQDSATAGNGSPITAEDKSKPAATTASQPQANKTRRRTRR